MNTKKCSKCNEIKLINEFHIQRRSKDNRQAYCKFCTNKRVKQMWLDNPDYFNEYYRADKDALLYCITNPIGEIYYGSTHSLPNVRWVRHKANYKRALKNKSNMSSLWLSFQKWGVDAHEFKVVHNFGNINKEELEEFENNAIQACKKNNKSLNDKDA